MVVMQVAVATVQVQPVPAIETSVKPAGAVSVTVTVPLVGPAFGPFETGTVYLAACCPWGKWPACVFEMVSGGAAVLANVAVTVRPACGVTGILNVQGVVVAQGSTNPVTP